MSYHKELDYTHNIDKVVGFQFSMMSPEDILKYSVAEIITQETYDGDNPKIGGLFDLRMGVLDHGKLCPTDGLDKNHTPAPAAKTARPPEGTCTRSLKTH